MLLGPRGWLLNRDFISLENEHGDDISARR